MNFLLTFILIASVNGKFCRQFSGNVKHEFHLLRRYQRSNKTVVMAADNLTSVDECAELARASQGLAFNYSPPGRHDVSSRNSTGIAQIFYNCEVLDCPEYDNFSTMANDTRFNYYSMYAKTLPNENSTCIPSTGIFMLFKQRSNYSKAAETCSTYGGNLAHIVSEHRNIKLSSLLRLSTATSKKERNAYVGLSEPRKRGEFLTSFNEPLQCFKFRAFALGHPSLIRARGCVALTPEGFWKVFRCNRKLLFVCELLTSGGLGC